MLCVAALPAEALAYYAYFHVSRCSRDSNKQGEFRDNLYLLFQTEFPTISDKVNIYALLRILPKQLVLQTDLCITMFTAKQEFA